MCITCSLNGKHYHHTCLNIIVSDGDSDGEKHIDVNQPDLRNGAEAAGFKDSARLAELVKTIPRVSKSGQASDGGSKPKTGKTPIRKKRTARKNMLKA